MGGRLCDGTKAFRTLPVGVHSLSGVFQIAAGGGQTCALIASFGSEGTVRCWGRNREGQLGDGTTTSPRTTPVSVQSLSGVSQISSGILYTCAVAASVGTV